MGYDGRPRLNLARDETYRAAMWASARRPDAAQGAEARATSLGVFERMTRWLSDFWWRRGQSKHHLG
jgi:hypothetical protein